MTAPNLPGGQARRGIEMPPASSITGTGAAALRGAALIALAVVIGVALLAKGLTSDGQPVAVRRDATESATNRERDDGAAGGTSTTTTEAAAEPHPPEEVTVWVLNGVGIAGIAGENADKLKAKGYQTPEADNASSVEKSIVYFAEDYEADAKLVADALGLPAEAATAMSADSVPEEIPGGDLKGAHIVVILGPDIQGGGAEADEGDEAGDEDSSE